MRRERIGVRRVSRDGGRVVRGGMIEGSKTTDPGKDPQEASSAEEGKDRATDMKLYEEVTT